MKRTSVWSIILFAACICLWSGSATGGTLCVGPGEAYTNLNTALAHAESNGQDDTIQVVQGTYSGNFYYSSSEGYSLILQGGYAAGCGSRVIDPSKTVLDAGGSGRVLYLYTTGGGSVRVDGFTIQKGDIDSSGGGIYAKTKSTSVTSGDIYIINNIIRDNIADNYGGGFYASSETSTGTSGNIILVNNIICENDVIHTNAQGGGGVRIDSYYSTSGTAGRIELTNNTITGNTIFNTSPGSTSARGGGVFIYRSDNFIEFYSNIIRGNSAFSGDDIYICCGSVGTHLCNGYSNDYSEKAGNCATWDNESGNIDQDPLLAGNYHLKPGSPCIDAGNHCAPEMSDYDFEGDVREIDGDHNGAAYVDMGADEYRPGSTAPQMLLLLSD